MTENQLLVALLLVAFVSVLAGFFLGSLLSSRRERDLGYCAALRDCGLVDDEEDAPEESPCYDPQSIVAMAGIEGDWGEAD